MIDSCEKNNGKYENTILQSAYLTQTYMPPRRTK